MNDPKPRPRPPATPADRQQAFVSVPDPIPVPAPAGHSFAWMVQVGGIVFGTIVAPVIVALILKYMDSGGPAPASAPAAADTATAAQRSADIQPTPDAKSEKPPEEPPRAVAEKSPEPPPEKKPEKQPDTKPETKPADNPAPAVASADQEKTKPRRGARAGDKAGSKPAAPVVATKGAPVWKSIFNGKDFTGWIKPMVDHWSIDAANQTLVATESSAIKHPSWIVTDQDYTDFRFRFECRMGPQTNSGITIRTLEKEKPLERIQIQLWGEEPKGKHFPTGTIIGLPSDASTPNTKPTDDPVLRPLGEWNVVEVSCRGTHVKFMVNGKRLQDVNVTDAAKLPNARPDAFRSSGRIGLQAETGKIEFRRIEVMELPPGKD
jgi:3-keto-disaccharide hydrolase